MDEWIVSVYLIAPFKCIIILASDVSTVPIQYLYKKGIKDIFQILQRICVHETEYYKVCSLCYFSRYKHDTDKENVEK